MQVARLVVEENVRAELVQNLSLFSLPRKNASPHGEPSLLNRLDGPFVCRALRAGLDAPAATTCPPLCWGGGFCGVLMPAIGRLGGPPSMGWLACSRSYSA